MPGENVEAMEIKDFPPPNQSGRNSLSPYTIKKLTSWDARHCGATYMYFNGFSQDDRFLVFASVNPKPQSLEDAFLQLYRLEISSGDVVQLTFHQEDPKKNMKDMIRFSVHPERNEVFYRYDNAFHAVNLTDPKDTRVAGQADPEWAGLDFGPTFSGDGKKLLCLYKDKNGHWGIAYTDVESESVFESAYLWPDKTRELQHVQGVPGEKFRISFVVRPDDDTLKALSERLGRECLDFQDDPDASEEDRARAWVLDVDSGKANPFLVVPPGHRATHEYWGPDNRLYFHRKTITDNIMNWVPTSISSIDQDGGDLQDHFISQDINLGHSDISPDGRWIVSDSQDLPNNQVVLIERDTGASEILCWANSTVKEQLVGHVHPSFGNVGKYVTFNTDRFYEEALFKKVGIPKESVRMTILAAEFEAVGV